MKQLLYISTARLVLTEGELDAILRVSRRRNAAAGITGLLVVGGRRFLQLLEGETDAVDAAFARIKADPRHFAVVVLSDKTVVERIFSAWSMGYRRAEVRTGEPDLRALVSTLTETIDDPSLHAEFAGFAARHAA